MRNEFDSTIRPQDDFFGYVNNIWLKNNPIPPSETSWGTFYVLRDKSWQAVHDIVESLKESDPAKLTSDQKLLKNFFLSTQNYAVNSEQHKKTLSTILDEITAMTTRDLPTVLGKLHRINVNAFWTLYVTADDKNSNNEVLRYYQSGLGMPNRDYYLDRSSRMAKYRKSYESFYANIQNELKTLDIGSWPGVWRIEKEIARASWTDIELRDVQRNYTKLTLKSIEKECPDFAWLDYFSALGWKNPSDDIVVDQISFVQQCIVLLKTESLESIKSYLKWRVVSAFAGWITEKTADLAFSFYGETLSGQKEIKPLWKRSVLLADRLIIGEALGREYASLHFPESSKIAVQQLVEEIRQAYHARIGRLTWMSDATKRRAHAKLDNIKVFVGYPTVWKNLDSLTFSSDNVIDNCINSNAYSTDIELAKVGKKPADEEWEMNAHTVNAYNHPNRLEIVFPSAILQSPFYSPEASHAENLGGIGAVIGHEFTHGFDDQGCEFDENGNTNPWQTKIEREAFDKLAQNIVHLGDSYETVPGTFLQGKLILGEAIADIGGLTLAVEALSDKSKLNELFENYATCECGQTTTERAIELAKTDPHPPSPFRVNCVVNHNDSFYQAYDVTSADKLYLPPESRAKIW